MDSIYDVLCCPFCWGEELDITVDFIHCKKCSSEYQIVNNIPIMIPTNKSDDWVVEAIRNNEFRNEYFSKRIKGNDGWWIPSKDLYYRLGKEYNLRCGRWKVIDDIRRNFNDILLVDVGGGEGFVLNYLQAKYGDNNIVSIVYDISNILQQDGQKRYNWKNLHFITGTNYRIALRNAVVDVVISTESIEHVIDTGLFLTNINRMLKKRGRLYITTPNYIGLSYWFGAIGIQYLRNIWRFVRGRKMAHIDKNRGYFFEEDDFILEKILRFEEIKKSLQENGFDIVRVEFTQFLGEITFSWARKLGIPIGVLKKIVRCDEFLEPIFNRIHLAKFFGFTQVIIAEKTGNL